MLKNQYRAKIVTLFERGDIMNSKELLNRFGSTNLFLALNAIFYTRRVKNPEKARLLSNEKNFDFLFLEIELYKPMGVFGRKSFFFTLNKNNLKEAIKAFKKSKIGIFAKFFLYLFLRVEGGYKSIAKFKISRS